VNGVGRHHPLNVIVMTLQWLFVEGRMRCLFGLLLGAGNLLLLERIEKRSGAAVAADIFHRRYMWLMLIGFIHGVFIWYGDILFQYGMFSLLTLYPLRNVKPKRLIGIGLAISLLGGTLGVSIAMGMFGAMRSAALQEGAKAALAHGRVPSRDQQAAVQAATSLRQKELNAIPAAIASQRTSYLTTEPGNAKSYGEFFGVASPQGGYWKSSAS
jgi:uncharacterized protein